MLRQILDIKQLRTLYYALAESQLRYGIIAWGGAYNCHIKNLEIVQKWILKIIHKKEINYPTDALYKLANVLDIRQLYCYTIILKQKNNKCKQMIDHSYKTRYKEASIKIPKVNKTITQRSFTYLGPRVYNETPTEIKNINSMQLFKNRLKKWLLNLNRLYTHQLIDIKNSSLA